MSNQSIRLFAVTTVLTLGLVAACSESANKPGESISLTDESKANSDAIIQGAGATFPEPLLQRWITDYPTSAQFDITYKGVGSGEGIRRFLAQESDFGISDTPLTDADVASIESGVEQFPFTAGMIVLAHSLNDIDETINLPRSVLIDIFSGKAYRWDNPDLQAVNPNIRLPSKLIQLVARKDSSGTTYNFTEHLAAIDAGWRDFIGAAKIVDWPGGTMHAIGNAGVAQRILISQGAIGYVEYGMAKRLGLPMLAIENRAGEFVLPGSKSGQRALAGANGGDAAASKSQKPASNDAFVRDADPSEPGAYPIVSQSFAMLYVDSAKSGHDKAIRDFFQWGLSEEGQKRAEELGYLPLPEETVTQAISRFVKLN